MPAIRFLSSYGEHRRGERVQVTPEEAHRYIDKGVAELVTRDEPLTPERRRFRSHETRETR